AEVKGDSQAAMKEFDDVMKKASPADKMETTWKLLEKQVGPFQKQLGTRQETAGKYDIVYVTCQFEKTPLDVRVVFTKGGQITGFQFRPVQKKYDFKPPSYARTDSFRESTVTVGTGEWALPGTLALPTGQGPFAAVALVQGSGAHDRDETIGPNKPFRDLAWGLASQGIAVLRYEKRNKEHGAKMAKIKDLTVKEEVLDDALSAVALLRKTKGIDGKRVFVLGHSLGAMAAPRLGERDAEIAGLILMAGPSRDMADVLVGQLDYVRSVDPSPEQTAAVEKLKGQAAKLKDRKCSAETPAEELPFGISAAYWLSLRALAPVETARSVRQPLLILQGGRDYQSTMEDFAGWQKALASRRGATLKSYPRLNHLFADGEGKATPAEYQKEGHVAKEVVDDIAGWVQKRGMRD